MRGDNYECLLDDDGLKHIGGLLKIQINTQRKTWEPLDSKIQT